MNRLLRSGSRCGQLLKHTRLDAVRHNSKDKFIERLETVSCYYEVLGVESDASQLEIEDAYTKLKTEFCHSKDLNYLERKYLNKLSVAYGVLSSIEKRAIYDLKLKTGAISVSPEELNNELERIEHSSSYDRLLTFFKSTKPQKRPLYDNPSERRRKHVAFYMKFYVILVVIAQIIYIKRLFPEKVKTWRDWLRFPGWYIRRKLAIRRYYKDYLRIYHNDKKTYLITEVMSFPYY